MSSFPFRRLGPRRAQAVWPTREQTAAGGAAIPLGRRREQESDCARGVSLHPRSQPPFPEGCGSIRGWSSPLWCGSSSHHASELNHTRVQPSRLSWASHGPHACFRPFPPRTGLWGRLLSWVSPSPFRCTCCHACRGGRPPT